MCGWGRGSKCGGGSKEKYVLNNVLTDIFKESKLTERCLTMLPFLNSLTYFIL